MPEASTPWTYGVPLAAEAQQEGDPERGWYSLLHDGYMSCGIPYKLWENPLSSELIRATLGVGEDSVTIAERQGRNAAMPYQLNAFTTSDGVEVVNANCLQCHAGFFNGELAIGLGNAALDFTGDATDAGGTAIPDELLSSMGLTEPEIAQFQKLSHRFAIIGPYIAMRTIGHNPAELLAIRLMLHHDRETLAWSDEPLAETTLVDSEGKVIEEAVFTSDPPPWWRAHKKNALFYNGMARGDHLGSMMLATSICVDTVEEAQHIDQYFVDMQAYIRSLRAPTYPFDIDATLAKEGESIFIKDCAGCHGTYAEDEADETYPNLLIPLEVIGTDPVVANGGVIHAPELVTWYNASFYGQVTRFEPRDEASGVVGYVAPPLDGVWATGPFLHNGSVPTIAQVLDSHSRPAVWRRTDFDTRNFDQESLGWPHEALDYRQAEAPEAERKTIYDTGYWSQSNAGHTFGDHLSPAERRAVLEYLKTL